MYECTVLLSFCFPPKKSILIIAHVMKRPMKFKIDGANTRTCGRPKICRYGVLRVALYGPKTVSFKLIGYN